ncbi:MAG: YabP/YqfC family sporulation protein [Clostridia bacterium]|nr:YabP/YqfC family sporulation protein [Clostridia bacterium]
MKRLLRAAGLPEEAAGALRVSLWDDDFVQVENHTGVADVKDTCVKLWRGKRLLAVNGQNLMLEELDGCNGKIKGKILSIEYLT